jgi:hypothetical protein
MDTRDDFYVTLVSSASTHIFPTNTAASFTHELSEVIRLPSVNKYWEVAVVDAILPAKMNNVSTSSQNFELRETLNTQIEERIVVERRREPFVIWIGSASEVGKTATIAQFITRLMKAVPESLKHDFKMEFILEKRLINVELKNRMILRLHGGREENDFPGYELWVTRFGFPDTMLDRDITKSFTFELSDHYTLLYRDHIPYDKPIAISLLAFQNLETIPQTRTVNETRVIPLKVNTGCYFEGKHFITHLNAVIVAALERTLSNTPVKCQHVQSSHTTKIICADKWSIRFTDALADILGFEQNKWYEGTVISKYVIDLDHYLSTVNLYTPTLVPPQYVGDTKGPLIASYALQKLQNQRNCSYASQNLAYYPVASTQFNSIRVLIVDDKGDLIEFPQWAQSVIKLHFRVKQ